jgi:hypothetical protein
METAGALTGILGPERPDGGQPAHRRMEQREHGRPADAIIATLLRRRGS